MRTGTFIICFFALWIGHAFSNTGILKELFRIKAVHHTFTSDRLGNLYVVNDAEILKYDAGGKLLQKNSFKNLGTITSVDASNPMKLLVFYKDLGRIVFLDNMLAPSATPIDLNASGHDQAALACTSHDDGFWIYNQTTFELLRLDASMNITSRTGNIFQLTGEVYQPSMLVENNNMVCLSDSLKGTLLFDVFGTLVRKIPLKAALTQLEDRTLYFMNGKEFIRYEADFITESTQQIPTAGVKLARIQKNRLYTSVGDEIICYDTGK